MSRSPLGFKGLGNVFKIKLINFLIEFNNGDSSWSQRTKDMLMQNNNINEIATTIHIVPREGLVLENSP